MPTFQLSFVEQTYLKNLESEEVSFKENAYDISVGYNSTHKSEILNIQKYSMVKNNTK